MKKKISWTRIVFITGVVALIVGIIDPLEGSLLILAGSFLMALAAWFQRDRHRILFLFLFVLIAMGVFALFYLSSLGGFGGDSELSWWWGITILPYPLGWLISIILLIVRAFKKPKPLNTNTL